MIREDAADAAWEPGEAMPPNCEARFGYHGFANPEINALIATIRRALGDRASLLGKFHATFKPGYGRKLCRPCAEYIQDEAGSDSSSRSHSKSD